MSLASCLYEGRVRHRRLVPVRHAFSYRLFLLYLDLEELPTLFRGRWLWSSGRPNLAWFRRADHLGPPERPLAEAVRDLIESRLGVRPAGAIRLLTHLRYFGFAMNPISLYYCFSAADVVEFVVAEVTNTPWGEQHCYLLDLRGHHGGALQTTAAKEFHVSPFFGMEFEYAFGLTVPGESCLVRIASYARNASGGDPSFEALLSLRRRPLTGRALASALCRYPLITARVFAAIYWEAFRLWRKRVPYVPHPGRMAPNDMPTPVAVNRAATARAANHPQPTTPQRVSP